MFDQKGQLVHQIDEVLNSAKDETGTVTRALSDEQLEKVQRMQSDLNRIQRTIDANETHRQALLQKYGGNGAGSGDNEPEGVTYRQAFEQYLRGGMRRMDENTRAVLEGNHLPGEIISLRGTDTQITTNEGLGGFTIPEDFANELEKHVKYFGPMLDACRVTDTEGGATFPMPILNDTANTGGIQTTEGGDIAVSDMTFTQATVGAYTFHSGIVLISRQLLNDNGVNLTSELPPLLAERMGRNANNKLTVGTGTDQPQGVVTGVTGVTTAAGTDAITLPELLALKHSVDRSYRQNPRAAWMFNDNTLLALKQLQVGTSDARPIWQPSYQAGEPDLLDGHPYWINNDMADIGAGNKPVLFGDFSKYRIRRVRQMGLIRSDERYMEKLSVAFLSFMRMDGKIVNTSAIKVLQNAAS